MSRQTHHAPQAAIWLSAMAGSLSECCQQRQSAVKTCRLQAVAVLSSPLPIPPPTPAAVRMLRYVTSDNPSGQWPRHSISTSTLVLHYAYSYERDVASKAARSCPQQYVDAARKGDKQQVRMQQGNAVCCLHMRYVLHSLQGDSAAWHVHGWQERMRGQCMLLLFAGIICIP